MRRPLKNRNINKTNSGRKNFDRVTKALATTSNDYSNIPSYQLYKSVTKDASSQALQDVFEGHYDVTVGGVPPIINPPYNPHALIKLVQESNTLKQCADAVVINAYGTGFRLAYVGPDGEMESPEAVAERKRLEEFFKRPNEDDTDISLKMKIGTDKFYTGVGYLEIAKDNKGRIQAMYAVRSNYVRITKLDKEASNIPVKLLRDGKYVTITRSKRFRRYVQRVGQSKVYFKEFGDPRPISPKTGKAYSGTNSTGANEMLMIGNYNPSSIYPIPAWVNQIPSILGSRESELVNYRFFLDNAIPAMVVMVAGGILTEDSLEELENKLNAVKGTEAMNRIVLLEATGDENASGDDGRIPVPTVQLRPMVDERQSDALFKDYDEACRVKQRSSVRIPPLLIGESQDYNYATANTSFQLADSQVLSPERTQYDNMINTKIMPELGAMYWEYRSLPPRMPGNFDMVRALELFNRMGAVTPNLAIQFASEMFGWNIPKIKEEWGETPFDLVRMNQNKNTPRQDEEDEKNPEGLAKEVRKAIQDRIELARNKANSPEEHEIVNQLEEFLSF